MKHNQRNNGTQQLQPLRIPTGRRQTSWLFTSAARKLNQGLPRTNSTSSQNPGFPDLKASALTTGPHCLHIMVRHHMDMSQLTDSDQLAGVTELFGL